jgi:lipoprotein-anchoring transpeptidase ErfK/SrfK
VRRAGLAVTVLAACALAGAFAAVVLADAGPPVTTPTVTLPTVTVPTGTTTTTTGPTAIAPNVTIGGIKVGGLDTAAATLAVQQSFAQPIVLRYGSTTITVTPDLLGASAAVDKAVAAAATAAPGTTVKLAVTVSKPTIAAFLQKIAARFDRDPVDAKLVLRHLRPFVSQDVTGRKLDVKTAANAVVAQLLANKRAPITIRAKLAPPKVTRKDFGPVIVIHRGANRLDLYNGMRFWRQFVVATGQSRYPTPLGHFQIVVMWKNPWWYPPASPWAKGAKPIPPGPSNPLGTRWMGLSAPGVGIHGTPEPGSIGYSVSHGCIRMLIPQAEWLFDHVTVGTQVFIVAT